ncbi:MAG: hypothetical protein AAF802_22410 [Planctomycetota bacterium]
MMSALPEGIKHDTSTPKLEGLGVRPEHLEAIRSYVVRRFRRETNAVPSRREGETRRVLVFLENQAVFVVLSGCGGRLPIAETDRRCTMEIHLSNQIEAQILASAKEGDYRSLAEQLAAAILDERPEIRPSSGKRWVDTLRKSAVIHQSWQQFGQSSSVEEIAAEQGIGPVKDSNDLVFPFWPEGEDVEDFIAAAKGRLDPATD